jgi:Uncharacterized protein conserved in bacteria (DUF2330)
MTARSWLALPPATLAAFLLYFGAAHACAPAPLRGVPAVNADQTVIMIWDAATRTQHFIRQASFKTEGDDLGFLVPTPTQPDVLEAGDGAFQVLGTLTAPEVHRVWQPHNPFGCATLSSGAPAGLAAGSLPLVHVLEEKLVAGFNAVVLESNSSTALVGWLEEHGYAYSPDLAVWARPYIEAGWKITALKVAKGPGDKDEETVAASALRLSFKTDRPLFPYREPDPSGPARALGARDRLLRIYFIAEARYEGELTREVAWSGKTAWAGKVRAQDRRELLEALHLPPTTGPEEWYLTEFEDHWPYRAAPADLYFHRSADQHQIRRPPVMQYVSTSLPADATLWALATMMAAPVVLRRRKR